MLSRQSILWTLSKKTKNKGHQDGLGGKVLATHASRSKQTLWEPLGRKISSKLPRYPRAVQAYLRQRV